MVGDNDGRLDPDLPQGGFVPKASSLVDEGDHSLSDRSVCDIPSDNIPSTTEFIDAASCRRSAGDSCSDRADSDTNSSARLLPSRSSSRCTLQATAPANTLDELWGSNNHRDQSKERRSIISEEEGRLVRGLLSSDEGRRGKYLFQKGVSHVHNQREAEDLSNDDDGETVRNKPALNPHLIL
jgi:hypothetical protein